MLYGWFATNLQWSPRVVDELEMWEAAALMGADSTEAAEQDDMLARLRTEGHTLPARVAQFRNIKELRKQQKREAAQRRRQAARRPPPQPQGDPSRDITEQVAAILPK